MVLAWIGCEVYHTWSSSPPAPGIGGSYAVYRQKMPQPVKVQKLSRAGDATTFYLTYGPVRAPLALVSGPPVYVFDGSGKLLDYAQDSGEDATFARAWPSPRGGDWQMEEMSIEQLDGVLLGRK
jgi:hypothetical protein